MKSRSLVLVVYLKGRYVPPSVTESFGVERGGWLKVEADDGKGLTLDLWRNVWQ